MMMMQRIINVCVLTLFKVMEIYEIYTKAKAFCMATQQSRGPQAPKAQCISINQLAGRE
jgi:hypothetical protein